MKKVLIVTCLIFFVAAVAFAAGPKTYQVTGPVLHEAVHTEGEDGDEGAGYEEPEGKGDASWIG